MTKIEIHIDKERYKVKPKNFGTIKPRLQHDDTIQEIELTELTERLKQGYSVSPGIMKNGTSASNWYKQQLFMVDIDNENSEIPILKPSKAIDICKTNNIYPIFYYYTFSHSKTKPKYRLVFLMNEPIINTNVREKIISTLTDMFPQSDKACKNADRIFLGTNKSVVICDLKANVTIDNVLTIYKPSVSTPNKTLANDIELDRLKKQFNFLDYLIERNGRIINNNNKYAMFENCEICGHHNDLVYYYETNSFNCFSANGNVGGSIIDYLMVVDKLSLSKAIDKFKYELCKLEKEVTNIKKLDYISAKELQDKELPQVTFYVNNILPQGLALICSVPKMGKSWLALDLGLSIARGLKFLGFPTKKSSCLYLALEDSYNRLKDRMQKLLNDELAPSNFMYSINSLDINSGLIEQLDNFLVEFNDVKVIIIDTLQKVRSESKSTNVYANDYKELSKLKSFADDKGLCVILIHHLKKGNDTTDIFDRVSGTNGITGTADTTFVLSKKNRSDEETYLSIIGRDVDYNDYIIKFNKDKFKWEMITSLDNYKQTNEVKEYRDNTLIDTINTLIDENNGTWAGTIKSINSKHNELYGYKYANSELKVRNEINKLKQLLMYHDKIEFIPANSSPTAQGRLQTFKKHTTIPFVEVVANVDIPNK